MLFTSPSLLYVSIPHTRLEATNKSELWSEEEAIPGYSRKRTIFKTLQATGRGVCPCVVLTLELVIQNARCALLYDISVFCHRHPSLSSSSLKRIRQGDKACSSIMFPGSFYAHFIAWRFIYCCSAYHSNDSHTGAWPVLNSTTTVVPIAGWFASTSC